MGGRDDLADRAEAHLNLGLLNTRRGQPDEAEAQYRTALRLEPDFVPALVNLADLDRARGRDQDGVGLLRQALAAEPNNAEAHHPALGLLLVRQRKYAEALPELRDASDLAPDNARYAYVYAVALNSTGSPTEAFALLERAHARFPGNRELLLLLVSIARDRGDIATALQHARELVTLVPNDVQVGLLLRDPENRQAH